jgi:DNA-binding MarR family transcriptional regulator
MGKREASESQSVLRHWHKDVPDDRMAHLIRDAGRLLAKSLQARLSDQSVSFGHWSFLRILWVTEGLTQRELSDQAGVMEPTTFTALKSMEKEGLIARRQLNGNRRKVHIFLTPKGRELKNVLTPMAEKVNAIALSKMSDEEINVTRSVLLRMIENLAGDELLKNH